MANDKLQNAALVLTEWLSPRAVGTFLGGVHPVTLWRWVNAGTFPKPTYFGSRRRWRRSDVEAWALAQRTERAQSADATA